MTIPNAITVARLLIFVPLVSWLGLQPDMQIAATIALALFGATDWIDGYLARKLNQQSRVGEILDPVADRFGIIVIALVFAIAGWLPWWFIITVAVSDLILAVIALARIQRVREGSVTMLGKIRTAVIMVAMPLRVISFDPAVASEPLATISLALLVLGATLHVVAASHYAIRYLSPSPEVETKTDGHRVTPNRQRSQSR